MKLLLILLNKVIEIIKIMRISDVLSIIAMILSILFSALTLILNRREKPNIMPYGYHNVFDGNNLLTLDLNNVSNVNIHGLTVLINGYDKDANEISSLYFQDKLLFTIGAKSMFNYYFNINSSWLNEKFYFRMRLRGKYFSRFPIFPKRKFEQVIWYSVIICYSDEKKTSFKISNTHQDEISRIESKHKATLKEYEKDIDKKFKS